MDTQARIVGTKGSVMRYILSLMLICFACPLYVATTKYITFGTWQSFVFLVICAVCIYLAGMIVKTEHIETKKAASSSTEDQQAVRLRRAAK